MHLSKRAMKLSPSPTVALNAKAKQMRADGLDVLNFAVGEPDFTTALPVIEVARQALADGKTKYGPAGGGPALKRAISDKLQRDNQLTYNADEIVCGCGSKELLFHFFLAHLNDGDEVLVPAPYWVSYTEQIKAAGGVPVIIPMPTPWSEGPIRPGDLEKYATDRTVGIVLTSPNNPAGYAVDEAMMNQLGDVLCSAAFAKDWWVLSDEIYEFMSFDMPHRSLLNLKPELRDRFFYVNGLSKGYAMTGWRVGYMCGPAASIKMVKSFQSHSSTCLPPFIEEAAVFALEKGPELLEAELNQLRSRRDLAVAQLEKCTKVAFIPPQGAFYLFIDVRPAIEGNDKSQTDGQPDTMKFCQWLLEEHLIAVVPGEAFGVPGFLRMSYAASDEIVKEGIQRLTKAAESAV